MGDFLGAGWHFPGAIDEGRGAVALSQFEENVRQSVLLILSTQRGERQMRPDFGCDLHALVFAENTASSAGQAAFYVEQALKRWEPRIEVLSVDGRLDGAEGNRLLIDIEYQVIATNNVFNLVYPFYLTEGVGA